MTPTVIALEICLFVAISLLIFAFIRIEELIRERKTLQKQLRSKDITIHDLKVLLNYRQAKIDMADRRLQTRK